MLKHVYYRQVQAYQFETELWQIPDKHDADSCRGHYFVMLYAYELGLAAGVRKTQCQKAKVYRVGRLEGGSQMKTWSTRLPAHSTSNVTPF